MVFNPDIHHRRSLRLTDYDSSSVGAYFVTICTRQRECLFGAIEDGKIRLNAMGLIVESLWCRLSEHFTNVNLDTYIVMPNHFHGILQITTPVGAKQGSSASPLLRPPQNQGKAVAQGNVNHGKAVGYGKEQKGKADGAFALPLRGTQDNHGTVPGSFCAVVQNFKSVATRKINKARSQPGCPVWQRNYYERIIRNENELATSRQYIMNNPIKWAMDKNNPNNM